MRARACIKCKEYVIIHPNNPLNQTKIHQFERRHHLHTLVTVNLDEVKEACQLCKINGSNNTPEELKIS